MENESQGLAETPKVEPVQPVTTVPEVVPVEPVSAPATQPAAPSVPETPKKSKKKLILVLGVVLVLILVAGGVGAYMMVNKQAEPSLTPTPEVTATPTATPDVATGWETYKNSEYGFRLKYPSGWILDDSLTSENYALTITKPGPTNGELDWTDGASVILTVVDSTEIDLQTELSVSSEVIELIDPQVFSFGGWKGFVWTSNQDDLLNYHDSVVVTKSGPDGRIYKLGWSQLNSTNGLTKEKYFLPLLASFEFVEDTESGSACSLSLCDCKCYPAGETREEIEGVMCGINCVSEYGVSGCELVDGVCSEI